MESLVLPIIFVLIFSFIAWKKFNMALALLFALLPTYLIRFNILAIPSTLLETMVIVLTVFWLIQYNKQIVERLKGLIKKYPSFFIASFLFLLAATISVLTSTNLRAAAGEWKAFYIEPIVVFLIIITTVKTKLQTKQILIGLVLGGFATSILAIYQHFTGWMVPWEFWENRQTYRVTGWYGFPNGVGLFLAPIFLLADYLFNDTVNDLIQKTKNKNNWFLVILCLIFLICSILAIVYAKSTGALIGLVAGLFILSLAYEKTRMWAIGIIVLCLTIFSLLPKDNQLKQELMFKNYSGQLRIQMWAETTEYLSKHPIKGTGLASYQTEIGPYRINKQIEVFHHPHNIFLTIWSNLGLLGIISFIWLVVSFCRITFSNILSPKADKRIAIFLVATMAVFMTMGLVDSPYIKNDLSLLFWLLPGLLLSSSEYEKNPD